MKKILKIIPLFILLSILTGCNYKIVKNSNSNENQTIDIKADTRIGVTSVPVGTFYNGKDGLSLSIPSGNKSTCVWTYSAGSGQIPYSVTTEAITATEKHSISVYGDEENFKVNCTDDFGNQYVGIFPSQNNQNVKTEIKPVEENASTSSIWNW